MDSCALCAAPIEWVYDERDRIRLALDPEPKAAGYLRKVAYHVSGVGGTHVVRRLARRHRAEARAAGTELYVAHLVTCPVLAPATQGA